MESYKSFAAHHNLPYILLSDVDGSVRKLYGVASTLGVPGRVTFVINKEGVVMHVLCAASIYRACKRSIGCIKEIAISSGDYLEITCIGVP